MKNAVGFGLAFISMLNVNNAFFPEEVHLFCVLLLEGMLRQLSR